MNTEQMLKVAVDNGIIDINTLRMQVEDMSKKEYLEKHPFKIWQSGNGRWLTYIKEEDQENRKLVSKKSKEELEDFLGRYYMGETDEHPVERVFKAWIKAKKNYGEIAIQSADRYEATYYSLLHPKIGNKGIGDISSTRLEELIKQIIHEKQLTYKTWSNLRTVINGIWKYAYKRKYTTIRIQDFMQELELGKRMFKRKKITDEDEVFTNEEVNLIVDHITKAKKPLRTDLGIILSFQTGLRAGEIIGLTKQDYDMQNHILRVNKTEIRYKVNGKVHWEIQEFTKGADGYREVYLSDAACRTLELIINTAKSDRLFETHLTALSNRLYRMCDELHINRRSFHKCRKTYATNLVNSGISDNLVAKMLGHTKPSTTYKYYIFNNLEKEREKELIRQASSF